MKVQLGRYFRAKVSKILQSGYLFDKKSNLLKTMMPPAYFNKGHVFPEHCKFELSDVTEEKKAADILLNAFRKNSKRL